MLKKSSPICPKIYDKLKVNKEAAKDCTSTWSGGSKFEVHCKRKQFVVDLEKHTCAYYIWDLTGIPCKHVVLVIAYKKKKRQKTMCIAITRLRLTLEHTHTSSSLPMALLDKCCR